MLLVFLEHLQIVEFPLIFSYQWHKILHIFGISLFMVNMIIGPIWFMFAYYSRNTEIIRFADRLLRYTDMAITIPSLDIAVLNGLYLASVFGGTSNQLWLQHSIYLLILMWAMFLSTAVYSGEYLQNHRGTA